MAERCDHYELLCRVAERRGWCVRLRSNLDGARVPYGTDGIELKLTTLDVIEMRDGEPELLARANLAGYPFIAYLFPARLAKAAESLLRWLKDAGHLESEAA